MVNLMVQKFHRHWVLLPVLLLASTTAFYRIDKPFIGYHDWISAFYSTIARNHLRYGVLETKFGQSPNAGVYNPKDLGFFTHYPPLLPIFIAGSFAIFGESEWAARLIPILASIGMIGLIYVLGDEIVDRNVGVIAAVLSSVTPIFIYFSKIPVHETVVPVFILLAYYFYIRWNKTLANKYYLLLILFTVVSELTGWAGYFIAGYITLHAFLWGKKSRNKAFLLILLSVAIFFLHVLHVQFLTGSILGGGLFDVFLLRFDSSRSANLFGYSEKRFITQEFQFLRIYFTNILVSFSLLWLITSIRKIQTGKAEQFIFLLLPFGLTFMMLFRNLAFFHDFIIYYLLPFIALSTAIVVNRILVKLRHPFLSSVVMIVLVLLVFLERINYVQALFATNGGERARAIGILMRQKTNPEEWVLVGSNKYRELWDVFIAYYGDRRVNYAEVLAQNWQRDYKLFIRPKDHDALKFEDKAFLDQTLPRRENDRFIWYEL